MYLNTLAQESLQCRDVFGPGEENNRMLPVRTRPRPCAKKPLQLRKPASLKTMKNAYANTHPSAVLSP